MNTALIVGRARDVWHEVEQALTLHDFNTTIVVGSTGVDFPRPFNHWVSYHGYYFPEWVAKRKKRFPTMPQTYWTSTNGRKVDYAEKNLNLRAISCPEGGSSSMLGVKVARTLGVERIVLAGIPMLAEAGYYDKDGPWKEADIHRKVWEKELPKLQSMIRSVSGWTQQVFGAPTREWLEGEHDAVQQTVG